MLPTAMRAFRKRDVAFTMQILATVPGRLVSFSGREELVKYFKAIAVSLVVAVLVMLAEGVLRLRDIPVRAGDETQALVRMWPALTAAIGAFAVSLKLFKPDG